MASRLYVPALAAGWACWAAGGCAYSPSRAPYGKTFYVGGAGNLGPVGTTDVAFALQLAGYPGQVEPFIWQSGRGAVSDQLAVGRHLGKAGELAARMQAYLDAQPAAPLNVVALSAGCGITALAIESLPDRYKLNNVVFLGCSLSSRYDLTGMLRHLRGSLYVYTSRSDLVLSRILPITGTVDRTQDVAAGLYGFVAPAEVNEEGRRLYAKLVHIPWRREFIKYGYFGQHIDTVGYRFIRHEVAQRIMTPPLQGAPAALARRWGQVGPAADQPTSAPVQR